MPEQKVYIGDGCYAEIDEFGAIVLTTSNGMIDTNRIVLEREVFASLLQMISAKTRTT